MQVFSGAASTVMLSADSVACSGEDFTCDSNRQTQRKSLPSNMTGTPTALQLQMLKGAVHTLYCRLWTCNSTISTTAAIITANACLFCVCDYSICYFAKLLRFGQRGFDPLQLYQLCDHSPAIAQLCLKASKLQAALASARDRTEAWPIYEPHLGQAFS